MARRTVQHVDLWVQEGGAGDATLLFLHGLGATGEVWGELRAIVEERWRGRWVIPDLRGHGRSVHAEPYSFGALAADVAPLVAGAKPLVVVGHSMGGAVGLALASGWFGVEVTATIGVGIKVSWTDAEIAQVAERARRPVRWLDDRSEALRRFLAVAGLVDLAGEDSALARSGVVEAGGRYRLASDPRAIAIGPPPIEALLAEARGRVVLACGSHDALVTIEELRGLDPGAIELTGLGHNAHVQDPDRLWRLIAQAATS